MNKATIESQCDLSYLPLINKRSMKKRPSIQLSKEILMRAFFTCQEQQQFTELFDQKKESEVRIKIPQAHPTFEKVTINPKRSIRTKSSKPILDHTHRFDSVFESQFRLKAVQNHPVKQRQRMVSDYVQEKVPPVGSYGYDCLSPKMRYGYISKVKRRILEPIQKVAQRSNVVEEERSKVGVDEARAYYQGLLRRVEREVRVDQKKNYQERFMGVRELGDVDAQIRDICDRCRLDGDKIWKLFREGHMKSDMERLIEFLQ